MKTNRTKKTWLVGLGAVACVVALATTAQAQQTKAGAVALKATLSHGQVLLKGDGQLNLVIDLEAGEASERARLPMNVALVIDRSGSMRGDKIAHTRRAAEHLVKQLGPNDTLSITSYSDDVRVDLPASRVNARIKQEAMAAIEGIRASGSTNLSGGLFRGQDEVRKNAGPGRVNRVLLMSDGLANRGITDVKALSQRAQQAAQQGITVTTLGVGTDYNEDLMTALADHGGGHYYFIEKPSAIAGVFSTELDRMFATVAQNTVVEFLVEDGVEVRQVHGYTFSRVGDVVRIPLADLFAKQRRSILVDLKVPALQVGRAGLGELSLQFRSAAKDGAAMKARLDLGVMVTANAAAVEKSRNKGVAERVEELRVAAVMVRAADMLKEGRTGEARKLLKDQISSTSGRARRMGGSERLSKQVQQLELMDVEFEGAELEPAAAPAAAKRAKSKAYIQSK